MVAQMNAKASGAAQYRRMHRRLPEEIQLEVIAVMNRTISRQHQSRMSWALHHPFTSGAPEQSQQPNVKE